MPSDQAPRSGSVNKPKSADLHGGPGFRIRTDFLRPDPGTIKGIAEFDTPAISDLMNRLFTMGWDIHRLTAPGTVLSGPACTVKVYPGDNLMVHKSLDIAQPGDVIVVDASASESYAVLGDLVSTKAKHRGIAGFIVDGLVRDLPRIHLLKDFPVFARGVSPIGPLHRGPGEINYPVSVGGIVVHPGDLVIADDVGVVVVPRDYCGPLLERLTGQAAGERDYLAAVAAGRFSNAWVDELLGDLGVSWEDVAEP